MEYIVEIYKMEYIVEIYKSPDEYLQNYRLKICLSRLISESAFNMLILSQ